MTYPVNYQTQPMPANYSGVTIQITNPAVNAYPNGTVVTGNNTPPISAEFNNPPLYNGETTPTYLANPIPQNGVLDTRLCPIQAALTQNPANTPAAQTLSAIPAYPPQYYLNNYNYNSQPQIQPKEETQTQVPPSLTEPAKSEKENNNNAEETSLKNMEEPAQNKAAAINEDNMDSSKAIISTLDTKAAEQKELEKTGEQKKIVALTNEYIMSLENYLNNPNSDIRLMAAKEILTRLDEDKNRYDDAALNALLNKMLQDPDQLIRVAALSALNSELASGNNYTVQILTKIQQNPDSDKEDVLEASEILLKMSADKETKYEPVKIKTTIIDKKAENGINSTDSM